MNLNPTNCYGSFSNWVVYFTPLEKMTKSFAAAALPSLSKTMKVTPKKITKRSLSADVVWKIVITTVASVFIAYSLYEVYNLKAQLNNLQLLVETRCSSQVSGASSPFCEKLNLTRQVVLESEVVLAKDSF